MNRNLNYFLSPFIVMFSLFLGIGLTACTQNQNSTATESHENKPLVVSTSTIVADFTEQIGEEKIEHRRILKPGVDPHLYEPTPQDTVALEEADLILYNGFNLEPRLIRLITATGMNADRFPVGEVVKPLEFEDRGVIKPDPHVWGDVDNAIAMVTEIRDLLIKLAPENAALFAANAEKLVFELQQLDNWILQQIATIPKTQKLMTTHDAFGYYAKAYGLEVAETLIEINPEKQLREQTVKNLANQIKKTKVTAIFLPETTINSQLIATIAEESGVEIAPKKLYTDSIGVKGGEADSYIKMLETNTRTIVKALGGKIQE